MRSLNIQHLVQLLEDAALDAFILHHRLYHKVCVLQALDWQGSARAAVHTKGGAEDTQVQQQGFEWYAWTRLPPC
jgi:hypothetical protein